MIELPHWKTLFLIVFSKVFHDKNADNEWYARFPRGDNTDTLSRCFQILIWGGIKAMEKH